MNSLSLSSHENIEPVNPITAALELLRRRSARRNVLDFAQYTMPDYIANWHHKVLCEHLTQFVSGRIKNLMVFMPPQHGKSQLVSRHLPAFILGLHPDARIVAASYAAELIQSMNRDVQRIIDSPEYAKLFPETRLNNANIRTVVGSYLRNSDAFEVVGHKGFYRCAGVGGQLTGFRADYAIIDDPYKDYKEATSETVRRSVWEWYTSTFLSRTHVDSRKLITLTRWHEADLAAQILELEGERWTVLTLPALCEDEAAPNEQRKKGEALWPERFPVELLQERRNINPHQFEALYQQNPTPREGAMFKVQNISIIGARPAGYRWVRAWDYASSENGDFTSGTLMGTDGQGRYVVGDVRRGQWSSDERDKHMKQTAELDGPEVLQIVPEDPGAAGKSMGLHFTRLLTGFRVRVVKVTGSKETRADPYSSQVNVGNVSFVRGDWNAPVLEVYRAFPNGKYDDDIDSGSDAFNALSRPVPQKTTLPNVERIEQPIGRLV